MRSTRSMSPTSATRAASPAISEVTDRRNRAHPEPAHPGHPAQPPLRLQRRAHPLTRRRLGRQPAPQIAGTIAGPDSRVPHPFAASAKGWESTIPNRLSSQDLSFCSQDLHSEERRRRRTLISSFQTGPLPNRLSGSTPSFGLHSMDGACPIHRAHGTQREKRYGHSRSWKDCRGVSGLSGQARCGESGRSLPRNSSC